MDEKEVFHGTEGEEKERKRIFSDEVREGINWCLVDIIGPGDIIGTGGDIIDTVAKFNVIKN